VRLVTAVASGAVPRWLCRVAVRTAAPGRQRTRGRVPGGPGKCRATATCVPDPAPCAPP